MTKFLKIALVLTLAVPLPLSLNALSDECGCLKGSNGTNNASGYNYCVICCGTSTSCMNTCWNEYQTCLKNCTSQKKG
jgi:hypothetical protein